MKLDDLIKAATSRIETVRVVRTAINPLLWLVGMVTPLCLVASYLATGVWMSVSYFVLACTPVAVAIVAYFWYMFRDPDRLQSEEYRLHQTAFQLLIAKKGEAKVVDPETEIARLEKILGGFGHGEDR